MTWNDYPLEIREHVVHVLLKERDGYRDTAAAALLKRLDATAARMELVSEAFAKAARVLLPERTEADNLHAEAAQAGAWCMQWRVDEKRQSQAGMVQ